MTKNQHSGTLINKKGVPMQQNKTCPKCGSTDLTDRAKTRALFNVYRINCRQCKYVELYAANPEELKSTRRTLVFMFLMFALITAALLMLPMIL